MLDFPRSSHVHSLSNYVVSDLSTFKLNALMCWVICVELNTRNRKWNTYRILFGQFLGEGEGAELTLDHLTAEKDIHTIHVHIYIHVHTSYIHIHTYVPTYITIPIPMLSTIFTCTIIFMRNHPAYFQNCIHTCIHRRSGQSGSSGLSWTTFLAKQSQNKVDTCTP